jgi:hypothetical protein
MGKRTRPVRMSSKREILRGGNSLEYYNALRQVSAGHKRSARFRNAKIPNRTIAPFWQEMGERNQLIRMSLQGEILRGRYTIAYYNTIRQVSMQTQTTGMVPACQESEPQNRAVLSRNRRTYPVTSYELETRNPSRSVLLSILQCSRTSFIRTQATGMVSACQESEPQNHTVSARNGRTYQATTYELETRNPSRRQLLSILQCTPTSFIWAQAIGTVPAYQESELQNHTVLARNGGT